MLSTTPGTSSPLYTHSVRQYDPLPLPSTLYPPYSPTPAPLPLPSILIVTMEAPDEHTGRRQLYVVVDNSNIWIGGKQLAGQTKHLEGEDPRWRLNFGALLRCLTEHYSDCDLYDVLVVGSEPPSIDALWRQYERAGAQVRVQTFVRSGWTSQEKMVDTTIQRYVSQLLESVGRLTLVQQLGITGQNPALAETFRTLHMDPASHVPQRPMEEQVQIVICAGDGDYAPLWTSDATLFQQSFRQDIEYTPRPTLNLWSWKHALAGVYQRNEVLRAHVYLFDGYFEELGDTRTEWDIRTARVPASHTIVIEDVVDAGVYSTLEALNVHYTHYLKKNTRTLIVILGKSLSVEEVTACQLEVAQDLANSYTNASARVYSFVEWQARLHAAEEASERLTFTNPFELLGRDSHSASFTRQTTHPHEESEAGEGVAWTRVDNRQKKKTRAVPTLRCNMRGYCNLGMRCAYGHTADERAQFACRRANYNKPIPKQTPCTHYEKNECKYVRSKDCSHAHGADDLFCTICNSVGTHTNYTCPDHDSPWPV